MIMALAGSGAFYHSHSAGFTVGQKEREVQEVKVELTDKGYEPETIKLKAGSPAKVTFVRRTDEACGDEVVIKDYGIKRSLPLNQPVVVEFTPRKGEFTFGCGMGMFEGKVVVN